MRTFQFWILLLASSFVTLLLLQQIRISRGLSEEQRILAESQDTITQGAKYENAWKQLAVRIFEASSQDPALAGILKTEGVGIHPNPSNQEGSTPASTPTAPSVPAKAPSMPPHPSTATP
jgi:hypothetical protein